MFDDEEYQLVGLQGSSLRIKTAAGNVAVILQSELLSDPSYKLIDGPSDPDEVDPDDDTPPWETENHSRQALLDLIPEAERDRILGIERHVWDIMYGTGGTAEDGAPAADKGLITERLRAKVPEVDVAERTLWRWYSDYTTDNAGLGGLIDKRKVRPHDPVRNLDHRIVTCINTMVRDERLASTGSQKKFIRLLHNRLESDHGTEFVALLPSDKTLIRAVKALSDGAYTFTNSTNRKSLDAAPDKMHGHVTATRPGEIVMMDSTVLDSFAYDPLTDTVISVELSIAMDLATRSIIAWRFTPLGTKTIDTTMLLNDMMVPETLRPDWSDKLRYSFLTVNGTRDLALDERCAAAAARPIIYPEAVLVDQGKTYDSTTMKAACRRLGISHFLARKAKGTDKPEVERAFLTVRHDFSQHCDGYKGNHPIHRGVKPEEVAHFTIDQYDDLFGEYIVGNYQRRLHDGLRVPGNPKKRMSPNIAYEHAVAVAGFVPPPLDPHAYLENLPIQWRTINRYGVNIDYLVYDGPILDKYRRKKSTAGHPKGHWPIHVDPRNLLQAFFKDPDDGKWHALRWVAADDSVQPFSDRLLAHVRGELEAAGRLEEADQQEVADFLIDLQNRLGDPESITKQGRRAIAQDRARQRDLARDQASAPVAPPAPKRTTELPDGRTADTDTGEVFEIDLKDIVTLGVVGDDEDALFNPDDDAEAS